VSSIFSTKGKYETLSHLFPEYQCKQRALPGMQERPRLTGGIHAETDSRRGGHSGHKESAEASGKEGHSRSSLKKTTTIPNARPIGRAFPVLEGPFIISCLRQQA
jgi:hypothetical protein